MFDEPLLNNKVRDYGWIEVVCGCMFSGKTEELLRRLKRASIAGQIIETFKPVIDQRYGTDIVTHDQRSFPCHIVDKSKEIIDLVSDADVVGIDEAQFFDEDIVEVCNTLANAGKRVIVAGLDMDYKGRPFGQMPYLLATAEFVTKLHAICKETGELASFSARIAPSAEDVVLIGEKEKYEARNRMAFYHNLEKE